MVNGNGGRRQRVRTGGRLVSDLLNLPGQIQTAVIVLVIVLALVVPLDFYAAGINFSIGMLEFALRGILWILMSLLNWIIAGGATFINYFVEFMSVILFLGINILIQTFNSVIIIIANVFNGAITAIETAINTPLCPVPVVGDIFSCAGDPANGPVQIPFTFPTLSFGTLNPIQGILDVSSFQLDVDATVNTVVLPRIDLPDTSILGIILTGL